MAPQSTNRKPFEPGDRRAELVRRGVTQQAIAKACRANYSLVSRVISGERLSSRSAQRIITYVARKLGEPIAVVFPEMERREAERRTGTDRRHKDAA